MAREARGSLLPLLAVATLVALATQLLDTVFVGSVGSQARTSLVPRSVGVDYLLRNGPKDADPPLINTASAAGPSHEVRAKRSRAFACHCSYLATLALILHLSTSSSHFISMISICYLYDILSHIVSIRLCRVDLHF